MGNVRKSSFIFVLLAGVIWGSMGIFVRKLNTAGLYAVEIMQFRITLAAIFIGLFLLIMKRDALKVRIRDLWCFFGTGFCSLFFFSLCYFSGIAVASLSVMSVLLYTSPMFVMLMSIFFFKEKLTKEKAVALILNLIGCCLVSGLGVGASLSMKGLLLGLGSGFGYALYSIFSRCAIDRGYGSWTITFYTFVICSIACLFISDKKKMFQALAADQSLIVWVVLMALTTGFLSYFFYTKGLLGMPSSLAAIVVSVEPVTATMIGTVFFHETLTVPMIFGMLLMFAGIIVMSLAGEVRHEENSVC